MFKRIIGLLFVAGLATLLFLFEECWIIGLVAWLKLWAIPVVTIVLLIPALVLTLVCEMSSIKLPRKIVDRLEKWEERSKQKAISRLERVADTAFWIIAIKTAVIISPSVAAVMLHLRGIRGKKAIYFNIVLSFVTSVFWCFFYSGAWIFLRRL